MAEPVDVWKTAALRRVGNVAAVSGTGQARHRDVVIVGGGVVGCAIAHELGRYSLDVTLVERAAEVGFGTSKANSGIIHGGHHASPDTVKGELEWAGNQLWGDLCDELGFGFERVGELTVALADEELGALTRLMDNATAKGVPGVEMWSGDQVARAEPNVTPSVVAAVHAPTTAVINPYEACFGLAESAAANGVEVITDCPVTGLESDGDLWTVSTPLGDVVTRFVVNAAGLFADRLAAMAGVSDITIRARKGEEYLLDKRLRGLVNRVIYPCPTPTTKGTLVIPTYDGTIMVGPTADEVEDRDDVATTADGARRVIEGARRLVPGITERDIIAQFAGSRAVLPGEDFLIGPSSAAGFVNVAGIQSPGLTAAPAIAVTVAGILADAGLDLGEASVPARLERPVHFAALPRDQQNDLALSDPRFGHIVCRCEFVTEGEIGDAIARGARTLDGIKFRTRAGMGRCQGGFCTVRCMALLAGALDVPLSAVTKRGGGSWMVMDRDGVPPASTRP